MPAARRPLEQSLSQRPDPYSRRKGLKDSKPLEASDIPPSTPTPPTFHTIQLPLPPTACGPSPYYQQWAYPAYGCFPVATVASNLSHPLPFSYAHLIYAHEQPKDPRSNESPHCATSPLATGEGQSPAETSAFAKGITSLLRELPLNIRNGIDTSITASDLLHNIDQMDWDQLMLTIDWNQFSEDELPFWLAKFFEVRDLWLEDKRRRAEETTTTDETAGLASGGPGEDSEKTS